MLTSKFALEKYKFFPYIAWGLVFGFSIFVYTIVQDLRAVSSELSTTSQRLEYFITNPEAITDQNSR
jgi:hypothetical protein